MRLEIFNISFNFIDVCHQLIYTYLNFLYGLFLLLKFAIFVLT